MDEKKENTRLIGGVSKNALYLIAAVILVLGLFLVFNVNAALSQGKTQQAPAGYSNPSASGVQSSNSVIPSQVGGCG